ncbi:MAG: PAS domain S-box protein [Acidobacteriota bacterium]|nr:PAS domain S-box protein [Acidobacteriota bacterium]
MTSSRILIVEDESIIARDIESQLLRLGHDVVGIAMSVEGAVAMAGATRPHLVLMDINLPGRLDGIDAAIAIREQFSIPSVFLTAYATDDMVERATRAEPLGYLIKPFDEQSLRTTIEVALHKDHADRRLRASEARYRAVVQSANDAIITVDSADRIVGWSAAAAGLFGYAEAEALGQSGQMLLAPGQEDSHDLAMKRAGQLVGGLELERLSERVGLRKDGSTFTMERSLARWETTEGWFITAFVRDCSARKQAEASMRLQSLALHATANAIIITDPDGAIQWVNPAFTTVTGFTESEAVGKNPRDLVRSGAHEPGFYEEMWKTLVSGLVWEGEITNRRKDGTLYVEHQTITPVRNHDGVVTNYIGVKRDMTEQKRLQEQLVQAQKLENIGRLAGGVAHDFNNLLTVINGTSEMALADLPAGDPMRIEFQHIQEAGGRAANLTRQLLAFSRKQVLAPQAIDLGLHVEHTAKMLKRLIGEDITLQVESQPGLDTVFVDPGQMEQILLNLAVNARDSMPRGGSLTISTRNALLDAEFAARHPGISPGHHVVLDVVDTGTGMTPDVQARIFEPFFTTKEQGQGTGLGLATVYGVVQQSGGSILVESAPGRGTRFTIALRRAEPGTHAVLAMATSGRRATGTETILIVDDDDGLRMIMERILRSAGYQVLAARDGNDALAKAQAHSGPLGAMVTDVVMPGMSGPELARVLCAVRPGLKVLYSSGYTDDAMLRKEFSSDSAHFIAKPYTASVLTAKLREVLDAG